ncbi:MAG TPA: phosphatidylethanolamine-binding protein, partial [Campylobacteraceae bacterium]|nr:phosphatidylethanolamine-binding protein [Campylobacteraceae bacterium]
MLKKALIILTLGAGMLMAGNFTLTSSDLQGQLT